MKRSFILSCLIICISPMFLFSQNLEEEISKLEGTFVGEWTTYKKNVIGEIEVAMTWKDTVTSSSPVREKSMAYTDVSSRMVFDNPNIPPYSIKFKEGFYIEDGKIAAHFFNVSGAETLIRRLSDNTFVYTQKIEGREFQQMRFFTGVEGTHTIVKVVTEIDGIETHNITRVTNITSKNEDGELYSTQFVSLKGFHRRIK